MSVIHLQGIGKVPAKRADEFTAGEMMLWNFGEKSMFAGRVKETAKMITILELNSDGKEFTRKCKKSRLIAIGDGIL
jgi:hypothetical protein